jgi:hypothetical protein
MSSSYRRADFERALLRRSLVDAAVEKLYLRRGGASIDGQMRMYDVAVSIATFCRESELERARKGVVNREKGERPLVSVSEGRLYGNKLLQLADRRDDIKAHARAQIMHALDLAKPQSDEEYAAAIEAFVGGVSAEDSVKAEVQLAADIAAVEAEVGPEVALLAQVENFDERRELAQALHKRDAATIEMLVKRQPARFQRKWAEALATA